MKKMVILVSSALLLACSAGSDPQQCGTFVYTSDAALPGAAYCVTAGDMWNACDTASPWYWANTTDTISCTTAASNATLRCQDADPCYMPNGTEGRCYNVK